jgi:hypothetical protein
MPTAAISKHAVINAKVALMTEEQMESRILELCRVATPSKDEVFEYSAIMQSQR